MSALIRFRKVFIAAGLVAVLLGFWVAPRISWSAARSPETGALRLGQVSVTYTILKEGDDYTVFYNYAADSSVAIDNVAAAMRQTATQWVGQAKSFKATLVFGRPLAVDEFKGFVKDTGAVGYSSVLRSLTEDGQYAETVLPPVWAVDASGIPLIGTPRSGGDALDPALLADLTKQRQIFGVISTDVMLDAKLYEKITRDPRVYAVDVLQQALTNLVLQKHPDAQADKVHVQQSRLYTVMENAGLTPGKTQP